jgi:hypothetical protein
MATMPGSIITAQRYHDYMWIYTSGEPILTTVDGAPPGPRGRLWGCDVTDKAVKVPYEAGRYLIEHCGYSGVVRVDETERADGTGTDLDLAKAKAESMAKFEEEDSRRWREHVEYCITDKINNKKAVPATPDTIKRIMTRRGYRLNDFGIVPVGEMQPADTRVQALQEANESLMAQLKAQGDTIARLAAKLDEALGEPVAAAVTKGGK